MCDVEESGRGGAAFGRFGEARQGVFHARELAGDLQQGILPLYSTGFEPRILLKAQGVRQKACANEPNAPKRLAVNRMATISGPISAQIQKCKLCNLVA